MTISITPITVGTQTFGDWVTATNLVIQAISSNCVTVGGNASNGDAIINGNFQVNTAYIDTLSGGDIGSPSQLNVSSVSLFSNAVLVTGANTQLGNYATIKITGSNTTHTMLGVDPITNQLTINRNLVTLSGIPTNGSTLHWNGSSFTNYNAITISTANNDVTLSHDLIISAGLSANNSYGSNGHVLVTNGSSVYWANSTPSSFTANGFNVTSSSNSNFNAGLLFVDATNQRVGISKTNPAYKLDVNGTINSTGLLVNGLTVWHQGNDGTGSGLDADLLDGLDSTGFIIRNATSNTTGVVTFTNGIVTNSINATAAATTLTLNSFVRVNSALGVGTNPSSVSGEIRAIDNIIAYFSSDETLKENVTPIANALEKVKQINGVEFDWSDEFIKSRGGEDGFFIRKHDVGVIAQEIEKVLPEVVSQKVDGTKAVKYEKIIALLIEAIKELEEQVAQLKK